MSNRLYSSSVRVELALVPRPVGTIGVPGDEARLSSMYGIQDPETIVCVNNQGWSLITYITEVACGSV